MSDSSCHARTSHKLAVGWRLSPCPGLGEAPGAELDMRVLSIVVGPRHCPVHLLETVSPSRQGGLSDTTWDPMGPGVCVCVWRGGLKASRGTEASLQSW